MLQRRSEEEAPVAAHTASNPPWAALPIGSSPPPRPRHRKMHRREGPTSWLWAVPRLPHSPPLHAGSALTCRQPRPPGGRESGNAGRSRRHTDLPTTPRPVPRAGAQPTGAPAAPQPTWRQGGSWKPSEPGGLCAGPSTGPRNPRLPPPPRSGPRRAISKDPFPAPWPRDQFTVGGGGAPGELEERVWGAPTPQQPGCGHLAGIL